MATRRVAAAATAKGPRMVQRDWSRRDRAWSVNRQRRIPAWTSSICQIRSVVVVGGWSGCVAPDTPERRADALHDANRRADHDRLHANPPPLDFLGLVLRHLLLSANGMARLGLRPGGGGGFFFFYTS